MFRKHYSDVELLAWRDGELASWKRRKVQRHLQECWSCQSRLDQLEEQIRLVTEEFAQAVPGDPEWVRKARVRFRQWQENFEREVHVPPLRATPLARLSWRHALAFVALATAVAGMSVQGIRWIRALNMPDVRPRADTLTARPSIKPPAPAPRPVPDHVSTPPAAVVHAPALPWPDEAESSAREIEIWYALHQRRACVGEQIEVLPTAPGQWTVSGVVGGEGRLAELKEALISLPYVKQELRAASHEAAAEPSGVWAQSSEVKSAVLPLQQELLRHYRTHAPGENAGIALSALANRTISESESCLVEAWAIRKLMARFPEYRMTGTSSAARLLLENMLRDHASALAEHAERLHVTVEPLAAAAGISSGDDPVVEMDLFAAVERVDQLARGLFLGGPLAGPPTQAAQDFLRAVVCLRKEAQKFDPHWARKRP